jgi:hypothetical protein
MTNRAVVHIVVACIAAPVLAYLGLALGASALARLHSDGATPLFGIPILVGLILLDAAFTRKWSAIGRGLMQALLALCGAILGVWLGSPFVVLAGTCVGAALATWFTEWAQTRQHAGATPNR